MNIEHLIGEAFKVFGGGLAAVVAAFMGRLAWRAQTAKDGKQKFFSFDLIYEVPIALFMGLIAAGIGSYFTLDTATISGIASVCGFLGPRGVEEMARAWLNRGKNNEHL